MSEIETKSDLLSRPGRRERRQLGQQEAKASIYERDGCAVSSTEADTIM